MKELTPQILQEALKKTILIGASSHLLLLLFHFLITGDYRSINMFNILDIDLFVPAINEGVTNLLLSFSFIAVVYVIVLLFSVNKKNNNK